MQSCISLTYTPRMGHPLLAVVRASTRRPIKTVNDHVVPNLQPDCRLVNYAIRTSSYPPDASMFYCSVSIAISPCIIAARGLQALLNHHQRIFTVLLGLAPSKR